jgi:uncharacterized protein (TIGR02646 family)
MMPMERTPTPPILVEKGPVWTEAFSKRRAQDQHCAFHWPKVGSEYLNRVLGRELQVMTAQHCAYCDHYELGPASQETIDHFRPKSTFPELAYDWSNLFPACNVCQSSKREKFEEALLKPDAPEYSFERFFIFDFATGEIQPCPSSSVEERNRAETTIRILGLNLSKRNRARKRACRHHYSPKLWPEYRDELAQLPYRFLAPSDSAQLPAP